MNHRSRLAAAAAVAAAVALTLSACGSSDSEGAKDKPAAEFTGEPITVLTLGPTGTQSINFETNAVAEAFAKQVNADGGIGGRELKVITCNEKADPNAAAACAREAVDKKVAAVVGGFTQFGDQVMPVLEKAGIPYLGNSALSASELSSELSFPIQSGPIGFAALGAIAAQSCDSTVVAIFDVPAAAAVTQFAESALKPAGKKIDKVVKVAPTTTDYSSVAKSIDGSDCALVGLPAAAVAPLVASMESLGVKSRLLAPSGAIDQGLLDKYGKQLEGSATLSTYPVLSDPVWNEIKKAIPKEIDFSTPIVQTAWVSLVVLQKVLDGVEGPIDAAAVTKALNAADNVDTGGLTAPLNFTKGLPVPGLARIFNASRVTIAIEGGQMVQKGSFEDMAAAFQP